MVWVDDRLPFSKWLNEHFLNHGPSQRPLLLLVNGHASHYNLDVIREVAAAGVILFCLPTNVTHVARPFDVSPFNALGSCLR